MITTKDINNSKDWYKELAWIEVYQKLIHGVVWTRDVYEVRISDDELNYTQQVQFKDSEESVYVWDMLESLGYSAESYYNYPNGNGDSGIRIYWEL